MTDRPNVVQLDDHRPELKPSRHKAERVKLTTNRINAAKATGKRQRIADADVIGLYLVVQPTGGKSFVVRARIGKGRARPITDITIGSVDIISLADARTRAKELLAQMHLGVDPRQSATEEMSVGRLVDAYLQRQEQRGISRLDNQTNSLKRLTHGLTQTPAALVSQRSWATSLNRVHKAHGLSAATDARKFGRAMMNWANNQGLVRNSELLMLEAPTPTRSELIASEKRSLSRWTLRQTDWLRFWNATKELKDPIFAGYLQTLVLTGLRRDEAAKAVWSDIDFDAGTWTIPAENRKVPVTHKVFIGPLLREILKALPRTVDLVFAGRGGVKMSGWSKRIKKVDNAFGEHIQLHGLRRGFRTALTELRVDRDVAELMIGHARQGLESLYDQSDLEDLRRDAQMKLEAAWLEVIE